jgi:hypothetical protein
MCFQQSSPTTRSVVQMPRGSGPCLVVLSRLSIRASRTRTPKKSATTAWLASWFAALKSQVTQLPGLGGSNLWSVSGVGTIKRLYLSLQIVNLGLGLIEVSANAEQPEFGRT